jgi:hypothetical protein
MQQQHTESSVKPKSECKECKNSYSNLLLHIVKTHKKFICVGCKEYKSVETAINNLADKNKGKFCNKALCAECFT